MMKLKISVLAIAVAFTASAFCLSSCMNEVSTLSSEREQSISVRPDEGASAVGNGAVEEPDENADDVELPNEDSEGETAEDMESENSESEAAEDMESENSEGEAAEDSDSEESEVEAVEDEESEDSEAETDEDADEEGAGDEEESADEEGEEEVGCAHTLEHVEYVAATCSNEGNSEYWYCAECDGYFLDAAAEEATEWEQLVIEINPENHTWEIFEREASCVYGEIVEQCTLCNDTYYTDTEPTGEHVYGEWIVKTEATCESKGVRERKCEKCGDIQTEEIEQLEHEYAASPEQAPTCTEKGVIYYECSYCSDQYTEEVAALGHDLTKVEAKAATCTDDGWEEYRTCSRCRYTTYTDETVIAATGHKYNSADNITYTCENCYAGYTEENLSYTLIYERTSDGKDYIVQGLEEGSECTELVIPDTYNGLPVTEIAEEAFYGNTGITSVTIGANVATIGKWAFWGCSYITEIYYNAASASVTALGVFNNAGRNSDGITLYIGSSVVSIPNYLFAGKKHSSPTTSANIIEIVFVGNGSLESIGEYSFAGCNNLTSVIIPSSCTSIGEGAFYYCTSLSYAEVSESTVFAKEEVFYNVAKNFTLVTY